MYKNYFYLNRLSKELDSLLKDSLLVSAYSQERDILVLEFRDAAGSYNLLISAAQNDPYIQYRKEFHRARKNVTEIFRGTLPQNVKNIRIAENDRVLEICLEKHSLLYFIRGKDTNVLLMDSGEIFDNFKKLNNQIAEKVQKELESIKFTSEYHIPDLDRIPADKEFISKLKQAFPFISKEIINEARARTLNEDSESLKNELTNVIKSIYLKEIAVFYDDSIQRMMFVPADFKIFSGQERKIFNKYLDAINYFLISRFKSDRAANYKKLIAKNLEQRLSRISVRINEIRNKLEEPTREEYYRNIGNLLLANLYSIQKGLKETDIYDFNGEKVKIKLDEKLDAGKNADTYFEKAKNEKQSRISLSKLLGKLEEQYHNFLNLKERFEKAVTNEDYLQIMADLKIKDDQDSGHQQDDISSYRHFLVEKKYHVYVGKDSRNNDQLTTRFAKQNDYWFHARSVSGSHVVLRVDNTKEAVPKSVLKKTASIAAFYSKAKTSKLAPVAYTLKKYVVKRKGMEPGSVSLLKENVLLVEPGIPEDCEYLNE